jgi:hypothetical protein
MYVDRAKPKETKKGMDDGMLDLATLLLVAGMCALPLIFMGYVRSRVRHALEALGKVD